MGPGGIEIELVGGMADGGRMRLSDHELAAFYDGKLPERVGAQDGPDGAVAFYRLTRSLTRDMRPIYRPEERIWG